MLGPSVVTSADTTPGPDFRQDDGETSIYAGNAKRKTGKP